MSTMDADRIEQFKRRIGFAASAKVDDPARGVVCNWPDPRSAPTLKSGDWSIAGDTTWQVAGGAVRKWGLRRGDEVIIVTVFVSCQGPEPARQFLLDTATQTTRMDIPYAKGPAGLGTLSVINSAAGAPSLIWCYRNVCFHVRGIDTQANVRDLATWLQSQAEAKVVDQVAQHLPAPQAINVSSRKSPVGAAVDLEVVPPAPDPDRYLLHLAYDKQMVDITSVNGLKLTLSGLRPGRTSITMCLIDRATVLSSEQKADLEFTGPDAKR